MTPLIDLKPDRCLFTPLAPPQPGDFETGWRRVGAWTLPPLALWRGPV